MKSCASTCRFVGFGLVVLLFGTALVALGEEKSPGPKTHVLFMGTDLEVQRDKKLYRVEDVTGSELKIRIGQREVFVPTRNRATGLKVSPALKLALVSVKLDDLQSGPSYTPANDPKRKFDAAAGAAGGAAAVRDLAYGRMMAAEIGLAASTNALANTPEGSSSRGMVEAANVAAQAEYDIGVQQISPANEMLLSDQFNTGAYADKMKGELAEGNYDAMEVSFKISSEVELENPYMLILFKFMERDAMPGSEGMVIHAKAIDPIGPKPRYIRVREGGLPRGFKFLDCSVHIYNRGKELATNASRNRVDLTRDDARQYLLIDYLSENKTATVPARALVGTLPLYLRKTLTNAQLDRVCFVQVNKDGVAQGFFSDESCAIQLDDEGVLGALNEIFFQPALFQGKPINGVARLRLAEL